MYHLCGSDFEVFYSDFDLYAYDDMSCCYDSFEDGYRGSDTSDDNMSFCDPDFVLEQLS
jgi:hypothetical protein